MQKKYNFIQFHSSMRKRSKSNSLPKESKTQLGVLRQCWFEWTYKSLGGNVNACGALSR